MAEGLVVCCLQVRTLLFWSLHTYLTVVYRKNKNLAHGVGFYRKSCATSTLRAHISREGGAHYQHYRQMCEKYNVPAVLKSPTIKRGDSGSNVQSEISSFLHTPPPIPTWSREGLLSHVCKWIVLDDQVRGFF